MAWFLNICCCTCFWPTHFHIRFRFWIYRSIFVFGLTLAFPDADIISSCRELVAFRSLFPTACWLFEVVVVIWSRRFQCATWGAVKICICIPFQFTRAWRSWRWGVAILSYRCWNFLSCVTSFMVLLSDGTFLFIMQMRLWRGYFFCRTTQLCC